MRMLEPPAETSMLSCFRRSAQPKQGDRHTLFVVEIRLLHTDVHTCVMHMVLATPLSRSMACAWLFGKSLHVDRHNCGAHLCAYAYARVNQFVLTFHVIF